MSEHVRVVTVTISVPDAVTGDRIAEALVAERLAACVKRSGPVRSLYRWEGQLERAEEWLLSAVTASERMPALAERVRQLHPHEVPEVVATPVVAGSPDYLDWVRDEATP